MNIYSRKVYLRDADHNRCSIEVELRQENDKERRDYETLEPIRGDVICLSAYIDTPNYSGAGAFEDFKPRTDEQKKLLKLLKEFGHNDIQAGTKAQQDYLNSKQYAKDYSDFVNLFKELNDNDRSKFDDEFTFCAMKPVFGEFLDKQGWMCWVINRYMERNPVRYILGYIKSEYTYKPHDANDLYVRWFFLALHGLLGDKGYKYGNGWLMKQLPRGIECELDCLFNGIVVEERELTQELDAAFDIDSFSSLTTDDEYVTRIMQLRQCTRYEAMRFIALSKYLQISFGDLNDTFEYVGKCLYKAGGREYYVGDDGELENVANELLHGDYGYEDIWRDSVANGGVTQGLEDWLDDVLHIDGWSSVLNHYDGQYKTYRVDYKEICVCRTD